MRSTEVRELVSSSDLNNYQVKLSRIESGIPLDWTQRIDFLNRVFLIEFKEPYNSSRYFTTAIFSYDEDKKNILEDLKFYFNYFSSSNKPEIKIPGYIDYSVSYLYVRVIREITKNSNPEYFL